MYRCLLLLALSVSAMAQVPAPFVGLSTSSTDLVSSWTSWYTSNGTGVPGTYSGPAYGGSQLDTLYGTTTKRPPRPTTDCPATSNNPSGNCLTDPNGYANDYSKVSLWSADNMYFIDWDTRGWLWLYLWNNGAPTVVRRLQIGCDGNYAPDASDIYGDGSNWNWSRSPGTHTLFYVGCTPTLAEKSALKAYNPDTNTASTIHDFAATMALYSGCTEMTNEREGESSDDDNVFAWTCNIGNDDNNQNAVIVYHRSTDAVMSKPYAAGAGSFCYYTSTTGCSTSTSHSSGFGGANYVTISPKGDYLLVNWNGGYQGAPITANQCTSHDASFLRGCGTEVLDASTLAYIGGATGNNDHGDVGCDVTGAGNDSICNEVFVQQIDDAEFISGAYHTFIVCQLSSITNNGIVGVTDNGGCQHIFRMPPAYNWANGETISMRATQGAGKGYMLLSGYDASSNYQEVGYGSMMNFALKMDWANLSGSLSSPDVPNTFYVLGRTHSVNGIGDYFAQANGCPDIRFDKYSFTNTMDHNNVTLPTNELPTGNQGAYAAMYTLLPIGTPQTGLQFHGVKLGHVNIQ